MSTPIFTSRKLEKLIQKLIKPEPKDDVGALGKWNATVFYIDRKKCWLISNAKTQYNIVLTNIKSTDLIRISTIFKDTLFTQLVYDGIIIDFEHLNTLIGELEFFPTDNDRRTTGFQNQRLYQLDWWKSEFKTLKNMPIKDLTNRMNGLHIHLEKSKKMSDFTTSIAAMKKLLANI